MSMKGPLRKSTKFKLKFRRFQKNFGIVVCQLRKERHLSRPELARLAKFSKTTLAQIEQGQGNPSLRRMENLAAALQRRLSYIFKLTQDMSRNKRKDGD